MQKNLFLLPISLIALTILSGCARTILMHPVTDKDIKMQDGFVCMSPEYVQEVMKVRIEEKAK